MSASGCSWSRAGSHYLPATVVTLRHILPTSFCCSCPQRPFVKRGYVVHLYHCYPASSATLMISFQFRTIDLYGKSLSFKADPDPDSYREASPIYSAPPFPHAAIHTPTGCFVACVCFFTKHIGLRPYCKGSTPAALPTPSSIPLCGKGSFPPEAAMFTLCYGL